MLDLGGLVGGLAGDSLKKGMRGVVGGIAGDAFDQGIGGVVGGLAGEFIDEPRNVLGGVAGAAVGNDFAPGGIRKGVSFLNGFMDDIGITEQNQEVMGSKEQVFPRYANPEDGTLTFGAPQGPAKVLIDGPPSRRRHSVIFDSNVDWEKTSPQDLLELQRMIDDLYEETDDEYIFNQAEPTGMRMAALDPTDDLLLRSLLKGEIGPTTDPNIRKAIQELERRKYRGGQADSMEGDMVAGMPRYIRGHQYAPRGVIMTVPDIDSRIFNERVKRGYVPMTPPPPRGAGGPQLPGFV